MNVLKNTRYYRWIGSELEEVRIVRIQNPSTGSIIVTKGPNFGQRKKIDFEELENNYTKLRPDGFITFNIVSMNNSLKDVVVFINRNIDIESNIGKPYAVCRQCVSDLFAQQLSNNGLEYYGISITQDTCPADVEFENYLACEKVELSESVSFYIGDKLSNILSILKHMQKYDQVLNDLNHKHCLYKGMNNKYFAETYRKNDDCEGFCKTLESLLKLNNFQYDLHTAFGVIPLDLTINDIAIKDSTTENYALSAQANTILSSVLLVSINKSLIVPYDKDIDLDAIKRKYCLISDIDNNIYLVAYTISGKYIPDIECIETDDNISKLYMHLPSESVKLAYEHLRFRKEKYSK